MAMKKKRPTIGRVGRTIRPQLRKFEQYWVSISPSQRDRQLAQLKRGQVPRGAASAAGLDPRLLTTATSRKIAMSMLRTARAAEGRFRKAVSSGPRTAQRKPVDLSTPKKRRAASYAAKAMPTREDTRSPAGRYGSRTREIAEAVQRRRRTLAKKVKKGRKKS